MQDDSPRLRRRTRLLPTLFGRLAVATLLGLAILSDLVWRGVIAVPSHLNPLAPLRIADEVNWLTRMKLSRLERDPSQCLAVLAGSNVSYRPVADRADDEGCGLSNAVAVTAVSRDLNQHFVASCPLAVALSLFDVHVIEREAHRHLGQDVVRVLHQGTYACRNINHRAAGRRSEHATANAIDVSGFLLADGQEVTVARDWNGSRPRHAAFLRAVRDGACSFFDVVLSPDYNEAHRDHFHFDMGVSRVCR